MIRSDGPLADPRHRLEALRVAGRDRAQQLARGAAGEDRDRDLGADPRDRGQVQEEVALLLAGEAVEVQRVVAGDEVGVQRRPPCRGPGTAFSVSAETVEPVADARRTRSTTWSGRRTRTSPRTEAIIAATDLGLAPPRRRLPSGARAPRGRSRPRARRRRGRIRAGAAARAARRPSAGPGAWPPTPLPQTDIFTACGV